MAMRPCSTSRPRMMASFCEKSLPSSILLCTELPCSSAVTIQNASCVVPILLVMNCTTLGCSIFSSISASRFSLRSSSSSNFCPPEWNSFTATCLSPLRPPCSLYALTTVPNAPCPTHSIGSYSSRNSCGRSSFMTGSPTLILFWKKRSDARVSAVDAALCWSLFISMRLRASRNSLPGSISVMSRPAIWAPSSPSSFSAHASCTCTVSCSHNCTMS
mmetsp:Transcript_58371/g.137011  ORF Transcript_58371/g.137011 Transcript_58371/m.137011 type:complete len:217 (+) Transcript_58371:1518-2168(+)